MAASALAEFARRGRQDRPSRSLRQAPLSDEHDELLFIVIHQAAELWLKLCLHELDRARRAIAADQLPQAIKMLARTVRAMVQLIQSWDVTPPDYRRLREHLSTSSGFQSLQYRLLAFVLGARDSLMVEIRADTPADADRLRAELERPILYDETIRLLARRGLSVPAAVLARDFAEAHTPDAGVEACWATVYGDVERWRDLYELAEKLTDIEHHLQLWRFGHLKIVERIIGFRKGTGGSAGVAYLAKGLEKSLFPELSRVRSVL